MVDTRKYEKRINNRLAELDHRMHEVDDELGHRMTPDLNDQAIDIEDDEVLEGLGMAAQAEVALLKRALKRIHDGTYGICRNCESPISEARLDAVVHAPLCSTCARGD